MTHSLARIRGNLRKVVGITTATTLGLGLLVVSSTAQAATTAPCTTMTKKVYERVNPVRVSTHLTVGATTSASTAAAGFTSVRDTSMVVATSGGSGLYGVYRLYRPKYGDYYYTYDKAKVARLKETYGFISEGVVFYAAKTAGSCLTAVYSYHKHTQHRFVTMGSERAALEATGWTNQGVKFYARKPTVDTKFSIAVMPDTQQEVLRAGDGRFLQRSEWLVAQRSKLDLRFVSHTGDVVNWDTDDHRQYVVARDALNPLNAAGIPYSLSIGNHDTQATGVGGSARDATRTHALQRDTTTFNRYMGLARQTTDLEGVFQPGKADNAYHVFTAGGKSWLVLNLELWPAKDVVRWASGVVEDHPRHNVIVVTHSYLTSKASIWTSNGGYGDTSPQYLYDELVGKYANVRMVFSGHVGQANHRVDKGVHGNRIDSYLTTMHSDTTNPTRLVEIDTAQGAMSTKVYSPWTNATDTQYSTRSTNISWVS